MSVHFGHGSMQSQSDLFMQFSGGGFDTKCYDLLASDMETRHTFRYVDLMDMDFNMACSKAMVTMLQSCSQLSTLSLVNVKVGAECFKALSALLASNRSLASLSLVRVNLSSVQDGMVLADGLKKNSTLTCLNLSRNFFDPDVSEVLVQSLTNNQNLTKLELVEDRLTNRHIQALTMWLATSRKTSLKSLNVRENAASGKEYAELFAQIIDKNTTLKELYFDGFILDHQAGEALAAALSHNQTLTNLNLDLVTFSHDGCLEFVEGLKRNKTLTRLNLPPSAYSPTCIGALQDMLEHNTGLIILERSGAVIADNDTATLRSRLEANANLRFYTIPIILMHRFHLSGKEVPYDLKQTIVDYI